MKSLILKEAKIDKTRSWRVVHTRECILDKVKESEVRLERAIFEQA